MPLPIEKQIDRLLELGFHEAAVFNADEFKSYVPNQKNTNGLLVVSERCLNIAKQCQLLGIRNNIFLDDHENLYPVPPTQLYWRYNVNDGRTLPNIFATGVELLKMKRLPANTVEILAIYREDPDVIKFSHYIDALGSRFRDWYIPMLFMPRTLNDEPVVLQLECYIPIEYRSPCWGTASYGSD